MLEPAPDAVPEATGGFGGRDEGRFGQFVVSWPQPVGPVLVQGAAVEDEGELIIPGTVRGHPTPLA
ncbi:hypothetical protein ACIP3A_18470 [Streptomyces tricolor]|uniref:hypothetical protein n=1 Tax=Streptomyces TaxID=1883 RepID=UPI001AD7EA9E|nr:hypothetical protein [Streptomyces sp. PBH53]